VDKTIELLLKSDNVTLKNNITDLKRELALLSREALTVADVKQKILKIHNQECPIPKWVLKNTSLSNTACIPFTLLSDIHWSEVVDPLQVNGVNSYNMKIAEERIRQYVYKIDRLCHDFVNVKYPGIVIGFLGDFLSGDIHEELSNTNELSTLAALVKLQGVLVWMLQRLADKFGKVFVPCVIGNHTRLTKKPIAKEAVYTSLDWLLYQEVALMLKDDKRITFQISDSPDTQVTIYGTTYHLTHGDQFRGGGGISGAISPWMIGDYRKRKRQQSIGCNYDYLIMGHFHQLAWIKGIIVNGSVVGYNEFASKLNFDYEDPQQALFISRNDGRIAYWTPIFLNDNAVKSKQPTLFGG
jgi:hypothetical protein